MEGWDQLVYYFFYQVLILLINYFSYPIKTTLGVGNVCARVLPDGAVKTGKEMGTCISHLFLHFSLHFLFSLTLYLC